MSEAKAAFARRLNAAFDRLEIPPKQRGRFTALARLFSVSPVAARDWCEGNSYPSVDKLLLIMDTVRCGADWLLFGRGSAPDSAVSSGGSAKPAARAGEAAAHAHGPEAIWHADGRAEPDRASLGDVPDWITVHGDAMAPTLKAGDQVALQRWGEDLPQDGIYALAAVDPVTGATGPATLRRVLRRLDGCVELSCDNPLCAERAIYVQQGPRRLGAPDGSSMAVVVLGRVCERRHRLD
jgi:hypothetical protein